MADKHKKTNKLRRIFFVVLFFFVILLIIVWLISGGASAAARTAKSLANPLNIIFYNGTSTGNTILLPWQLPALTRGPDISQYANTADQQLEAASQNQGENAPQDPGQARTFGNPSPYAGKVTVGNNDATASDPAQEYVELDASAGNSGAIDITGWSLQSAVSGGRAYIMQAAPILITGIVNSVRHVALDPGASAIVVSGASPVGVSFQENVCIGYLAQLQTFTPDLSNSCPTPSDMLPETADNLRTYGPSCLDYVRNLPQCYFPGANLPSNLSPACRSFIADTMSYNGCVSIFDKNTDFTLPSWRLFLNMTRELWNNSHDVVRLLDAQGRTVDALTY
jgi:hypothetical protein